MTLVRALRLLILGETWALPLGVAGVLVASALLRRVAPNAWHDAGGFLLLAGVIVVLVVSLSRTRG